jgi:hypothetical protein
MAKRKRDIVLHEEAGRFILDDKGIIAADEYDSSDIYTGISQPTYCPFCRDSRPGEENIHTEDAHRKCVVHYLAGNNKRRVIG